MNTNDPAPIIQTMQTTDISPPSSIPLANEKALLPKNETLQTKDDHAVAVIDAQPVAATSPGAIQNHPPRKSRRRGRVASIPKLQRDMVNRMLWNGVPYKNIVVALQDAGYTVIERNISNWATGGYLEWRLEQEAVLENRLNQDHLLDFLRRDDAPELPEVGLQAAATRLSQVLLQKLAHADDAEANLDSYTKLVDLLCRLNREISATQKNRDNSRRTLGRDYNPALVKDVDEVSAIETERYYSDPPSDSKLEKPAVPPLLPQIPTATFLAEQTLEKKHDTERAEAEKAKVLMQHIRRKYIDSEPQPPKAPNSEDQSSQSA